MSELNEKLQEIKRQKDTYILPENLKKGVTAFGVTGALDSGVKLFDTVEHMQQDENPHEGDLAVVYREELQSITEDSEFDSCIFSNTVILDGAFTDNIFGDFRNIGSGYFEGYVELSSSNFRFSGYGGSGEIRVQYESQDGITYTRTDGGEELQEFGTTIKLDDRGDPFNSVIGNFMKIGGNYFDGLYEYGPFVRNIVAFNTENIDVTTSPYINVTNTNIKVEVDTLDKCCKAVRRYLCGGDNYIFQGDFYLTFDLKNIIYVGNYSSNLDRYVSIEQLFMNIANNKIYLPVSSNRSDLRDTNNKILNYNIENETITEITLQGDTTFVDINSNSYSCKEFNGYFLTPNSYSNYTINWVTNNSYLYNYLNWENNNSKQVQLKEINTSIYVSAKSQLNATPDYVYGKTFYGKNGAESGTLITNISNSFADVNAEIYAKIQEQYENMQPRVLTDQDKEINTNIYFIPTNKNGEILIDTSNVTNMYGMFSNCSNLTAIPLLDTGNATNMQIMFGGCSNLTSIPLLDTSNVTDMDGMFSGCSGLTTIPLIDTSNVTDMRVMFSGCSNLTTIPLLDTSNAVSMYYMFNQCSSLVTVPQLNTSNLEDGVQYISSGMQNMFSGCIALSNESLNNILAMCINATKITSNKTLKYLGLTQEQATTCQSLSNYQDFVNAGWTTGY